MTVRLGFEVGSGHPVNLEIHHLVIAGLTQLSGKTTTLEALIARSGLRAIAFRTKRGEIGFDSGKRIRPFFRERSDWQYIAALLEATMRERLKFERPWIIKVTKGTHSLLDVRVAIQNALETARGLSESVYTSLAAYLDLVLPQLQDTDFATELTLGEKGLHIMDLEGLSPEMQSLVIQSTMDRVMDYHHDVIVIVPEAWKFIPQKRGNPVKWAAERFVREGATLQNYLWLDSQDIAGVDKSILKSVNVWILGRQREFNEVKRTIAQLPVPASQRPAPEEVMGLPLGHFFATVGDGVLKVYVQPEWLRDNDYARGVAMGLVQIPKPGAKRITSRPKPKKSIRRTIRRKSAKTIKEEEEKVYREKYEKLKAEHEATVKALEELEGHYQEAVTRASKTRDAKEQLEAEIETATALDDKRRLERARFETEMKKLDTFRAAFSELMGDLGLPRVGTPNPSESAALEIEQSVSEMNIERKLVRYDATDRDLRGRLGLLIAEGHFDQPTSALVAWQELQQRDWTGTKASRPMAPFYRELNWFTERGFLRHIRRSGKRADEWEATDAKDRIRVRELQAKA